jgi:hypothetical protein
LVLRERYVEVDIRDDDGDLETLGSHMIHCREVEASAISWKFTSTPLLFFNVKYDGVEKCIMKLISVCSIRDQFFPDLASTTPFKLIRNSFRHIEGNSVNQKRQKSSKLKKPSSIVEAAKRCSLDHVIIEGACKKVLRISLFPFRMKSWPSIPFRTSDPGAWTEDN